MISARVAQRCLRKLGDDAEHTTYIFTELASPTGSQRRET